MDATGAVTAPAPAPAPATAEADDRTRDAAPVQDDAAKHEELDMQEILRLLRQLQDAQGKTAQEEVQQAIRQDTTTVLSKLKTVKTMLSVFVDNFYAEGREREDLLRAMREQLEKVQLGQQRADSRAVQAEKRAAAAEAKLRAQQEGFAKSMQALVEDAKKEILASHANAIGEAVRAGAAAVAAAAGKPGAGGGSAAASASKPAASPAPPSVDDLVRAAVVKANVGMSKTRKQVVRTAAQGVYKYQDPGQIATHIKEEAERMYGGYWHCAVFASGQGGAHYTFDPCHLAFTMGRWEVTLWQTDAEDDENDWNFGDDGYY